MHASLKNLWFDFNTFSPSEPNIFVSSNLKILLCFLVESEDEDDEVEFATAPPAKTSVRNTRGSVVASRPPLKAQQVTSASSSGVNANSRQKRLEEFRQNRAAKKLAETKKPPPFKVGVYKLETNVKPGKLNHQSFNIEIALPLSLNFSFTSK